MFVAKFASAGTLIWAKSFGATTEDCGKGIDLDATGNVYTTGYFYGAADFNPGAATNTLTPAGNCDAFISKLDATGNFVWAKKMGGTDFDFGNALNVDGSGNVVAAGYFQGTGDFDPGSVVYNLTSAGSYDMFISKSQNTSEVSDVNENTKQLIIYPNPASEQIVIKGEKISSVSIFSITGQILKSQKINNADEVSVVVNELENGYYFIRIQEKENFSVLPFVKK
ncbi:MAG: T9SS type A sorting domain-containing protein [Actinobacteria bacterium]|nr:T9SS type A sorting domain-containing protein [Actinomycetota bacterium]